MKQRKPDGTPKTREDFIEEWEALIEKAFRKHTIRGHCQLSKFTISEYIDPVRKRIERVKDGADILAGPTDGQIEYLEKVIRSRAVDGDGRPSCHRGLFMGKPRKRTPAEEEADRSKHAKQISREREIANMDEDTFWGRNK